jgi:peptide/nickel transport system ATP-binding protein
MPKTKPDHSPTLDPSSVGEAPLLEIRSLKKYFPIEKGLLRKVVGHVRAVDDVSMNVYHGQTVGLVGESGSGKTTLAHCVLRAYDLTAGEIIFRPDGIEVDLGKLSRKELRAIRPHIQMVFQDPYSSLDPRKTVFDIVSEPLRINGAKRGSELESRVRELLEATGLDHRHMKRYPHAFSGGQRQRIGVARALALNPTLIVCDEPVSALDVSVQAQILNLLNELQAELNLSYLFIAHNLSVIEHICDLIAVMYVGKLMEYATADALFRSPKHPYTEALLSAIPIPDPDRPLADEGLGGELPDPANPPNGCYFHPRCKYVADVCRTEQPPWEEVAANHYSRCHFARELSLRGVR